MQLGAKKLPSLAKEYMSVWLMPTFAITNLNQVWFATLFVATKFNATSVTKFAKKTESITRGSWD